MINQTLSIRRATPDDATLIADMGTRTFEAAFGAENSLEDMEQYLALNFSKTQIADRGRVFTLD